MKANTIAQIVEDCFNKIDFDSIIDSWKDIPRQRYGHKTDEWINTRIEDKAYFNWCRAISLLESYLRWNFETFEETELVRKWAKSLCDDRNDFLNGKRSGLIRAGGGYSSLSR